MAMWIILALRNLAKNKRRSFFTVMAVALGFAAVNIFGGYTHYIATSLRDGYVYGMPYGHLTVFKTGHMKAGATRPAECMLEPGDVQAVKDILLKDARVRVVTPQIYLTGLISNGKMSTIFISLARVVDETASIRSMAEGLVGKLKLYDGEPLQDAVPHGIGISGGLMARLDLKLGDSVVLMAPTVDGQMNAVDAVVFCTFEPQNEMMRDTFIVQTLSAGRQLLDTGGADRLIVALSPDADVNAMRDEMERKLRAAGLDVEVFTWEALNPSYGRIQEMFDVIFIFLFVIVFVIVVLSVVNTISMAVMERTREIGTMRALGLRRSGLLLIFGTESAMLASVGAAIGLALTMLCWAAIIIIKPTWIPPTVPKRVPFEIHLVPEYMVGAFVCMVVLAVLAAVLPAGRAARMGIVDELGHV
ncbi:MAG: FtsX-like permease family protein [bacterium]